MTVSTEQHASEITIAHGGKVYFAPYGSTLPAKTDARIGLASQFLEVGYITEDGAHVTAAKEILEVPTWQTSRPARRDSQRNDFTVAFGLLQDNAENMVLAFGGGSAYTTAAGVTVYEFPTDEEPLDEVSLVVDYEDKGINYRLVFPYGNVVEGVDFDLMRTGPTVYPVTFSLLGGQAPYKVTNSPAYGPVS